MSHPVKIPADLDHPDRVLAGLTARQVVILAGTGVMLYCGWLLARPVLGVLVYLAAVTPLGVAGIALALFRRDGQPLDRLVLAALGYRLRPRRLAGPRPTLEPVPGWVYERAADLPSPPGLGGEVGGWRGRIGRLDLPNGIDPFYGAGPGVLDLGGDGLALLAVATPVPFALRSPADQQHLVDCFARLLLGADTPIQIVVRAVPVELRPTLSVLADAAARLPHPALRAAAGEHHQFLAGLGARAERPLLTRQVVLVLRDPTPHRAGHRGAGEVREAAQRLGARLEDAARALAPAGVLLTALSAADADTVLTTATSTTRPATHVPAPLLWPTPQTSQPWDGAYRRAASADRSPA